MPKMLPYVVVGVIRLFNNLRKEQGIEKNYC